MQKNENPIVLSLVLLVTSVVVALILAFTNSVTKDKIAENTRKEQDAAKIEVLAGATIFEDVDFKDETGLVKNVYLGKNEKHELIGWCVSVTPSGYGGVIDTMVGISRDGAVSGVKIISLSETPGLGAKATDASFLDQFAGKLGDGTLAVIKSGTAGEGEIMAISGATITSSAVKDGVNAAAKAVESVKGGKN